MTDLVFLFLWAFISCLVVVVSGFLCVSLACLFGLVETLCGKTNMVVGNNEPEMTKKKIRLLPTKASSHTKNTKKIDFPFVRK